MAAPSIMNNRQPLWTRDFILVIAANLAVFAGFQLMLPTLPKYVIALGGDRESVGLILGIFTISAVAFRPWFGRQMDLRGRRGIWMAGLVVFVLVALSYGLAGSLGALFAMRIVHGIGWGASTTAAGTVAADLIPPRRRGEGMGYFGLASNLAMAVGPALGLAIVGRFGFRIMFLSSALLALGALAFAALIHYPPMEREAGRPALVERAVLAPAAIMFLMTVSYGGVVSFITLLAEERGIGTDLVGLFFTAYAVVLILTRPAAGLLADRSGPTLVVIPGSVFLIAGLVLLALVPSPAALLWSGALYGLGFGAIQPIILALVVDLVPPSRRGTANATFFSAFDLGIGLGSMGLGVVAGWIGFRGMYLAAAVVAFLGLLLYVALREPLEAARRSAGRADGRQES